MFSIITDSTSDLSLEFREKYGIDYCKMEFSEGDTNYHASLDWDEISFKEFYGSMRQGKRYKTVQVPVKTFDEKFREHLEKGNDILYIACSSGLSGSINTARVISEELRSAYPGRKIVCIDSLISGMGQGSMAIKAAEMQQEGLHLVGACPPGRRRWRRAAGKSGRRGECEEFASVKFCVHVVKLPIVHD